ncbi:MAG: hypothetical protein HGA85_01725 [Nanoarchaeota archaeon]|nr:hypothetical protein [Nanoarchaeota archaeon]
MVNLLFAIKPNRIDTNLAHYNSDSGVITPILNLTERQAQDIEGVLGRCDSLNSAESGLSMDILGYDRAMIARPDHYRIVRADLRKVETMSEFFRSLMARDNGVNNYSQILWNDVCATSLEDLAQQAQAMIDSRISELKEGQGFGTLVKGNHYDISQDQLAVYAFRSDAKPFAVNLEKQTITVPKKELSLHLVGILPYRA